MATLTGWLTQLTGLWGDMIAYGAIDYATDAIVGPTVAGLAGGGMVVRYFLNGLNFAAKMSYPQSLGIFGYTMGSMGNTGSGSTGVTSSGQGTVTTATG